MRPITSKDILLGRSKRFAIPILLRNSGGVSLKCCIFQVSTAIAGLTKRARASSCGIDMNGHSIALKTGVRGPLYGSSSVQLAFVTAGLSKRPIDMRKACGLCPITSNTGSRSIVGKAPTFAKAFMSGGRALLPK